MNRKQKTTDEIIAENNETIRKNNEKLRAKWDEIVANEANIKAYAKSTERKILLILSSLLQLGGFVWLFFINWKIGLCIFLIIWGQNILMGENNEHK